MALSSEGKKQFANDFRYVVDQYTLFLTQYNQLLCKSVLSDEEKKEFLSLQDLILSIGEVLSLTLQTLSEDLFGKAMNLYYQYKFAAENGSENAEIIMKELKPIFASTLQGRICKN